ncbi:hypothetical protein AGIG_G6630 [Arapaima gigas]
MQQTEAALLSPASGSPQLHVTIFPPLRKLSGSSEEGTAPMRRDNRRLLTIFIPFIAPKTLVVDLVPHGVLRPT